MKKKSRSLGGIKNPSEKELVDIGLDITHFLKTQEGEDCAFGLFSKWSEKDGGYLTDQIFIGSAEQLSSVLVGIYLNEPRTRKLFNIVFGHLSQTNQLNFDY